MLTGQRVTDEDITEIVDAALLPLTTGTRQALCGSGASQSRMRDHQGVQTPYPVPTDDEDRLAVLAEYHVMDTDPEASFDRLTGLAARLFDIPIVLVSLIGRDRQFFKSRVGLNVCETSREVSFCAHAIMQDDILFIPDATDDPRFAANPLVLGPPFIRFYAGKPLIAPGGARIGTVCLIDSVPRAEFTEEDRRNLTELASLVMDRLEVRRLDHVRTVSQARFENIAATSPDAIICSSTQGRITFWNSAAERLFGYSQQEVLGGSADFIVTDRWRRIYDSELARLRRGEPMELAGTTIELSGRHKDGSEFPAEFSLSTWAEGDATSVGAIVRDVSERKANEERLFRLASLDALTQLPNRAAWRERLAAVVDSATPATVALIDLDEFKLVNDTLGHSAGDAVLKEVAARLQATCPDSTMVARLGGDEFVALLPGNDARRARAAAEALVSAISAPYDFAGERADIGVSIGVALHPQHSSTSEELLTAADLALYRAKASGRGRYEVFTPALREVATARRAFELELKTGFEDGQFELFYQPQVATDSGQVVGAEALIRWNHPTRGLLSPVSFIDVLSQKASAAEIGEWILHTACEQAVPWRETIPGFRVSVNLFEAQFRPGRLLPAVVRTLSETGLPADALELEIVENVVMGNDERTRTVLKNLREMGVGLAFDDYGTGFASLSLLKQYPVSRLKIDRSFVRHVDTDEENAGVVKAVLYLAEIFGMTVTAEGVETQAQLDFLRENACPELQGYLFGAPVPAAEFARRFVPITPGCPSTPG